MQTLPQHHQAEIAREAENFDQALSLYAEVIAAYQAAQAHGKVAEALQGRVITYKHLFSQTHDQSYLEKAKQDAEASLRIIGNYHVGDLANAHASLAEVYQLKNDYKAAADSFRQALGTLVEKNEFQRGRYHYHLGSVLIELGQKAEGEQLIRDGIEEITAQQDKLDDYTYRVWLSGAYMALATALRDHNQAAAKDALQKAAEIVSDQPQLKIRSKQLQQLKEKFADNKAKTW